MPIGTPPPTHKPIFVSSSLSAPYQLTLDARRRYGCVRKPHDISPNLYRCPPSPQITLNAAYLIFCVYPFVIGRRRDSKSIFVSSFRLARLSERGRGDELFRVITIGNCIRRSSAVVFEATSLSCALTREVPPMNRRQRRREISKACRTSRTSNPRNQSILIN